MADRPYFLKAFRPYSLQAFCMIWMLNLLPFWGKPLFVYGWSALFLESFLLDLVAKFACFWL
jgi:hypothetical protein